MCGIVGYIGKKNAVNVLMTGLMTMEYRGYDSSGLSLIESGEIVTWKKKGKIGELQGLISNKKFTSNIGIAHTRWATHGEPNDLNAHPHSDNSGNISIVHNGIIENYQILKENLIKKGYFFKTQTDTEVLAVLISYHYDKVKDLEYAVRLALNEVEGTFGLLVLSSYAPTMIVAARRGSPLVLGIGDAEYIVASDASAIIQATKNVVYLHDNEMVVIDETGFITKTINNEKTEIKIEEIEYDIAQIQKGGYDYFMLKEIYEQPETVHNAFRGRLLMEFGNVRLGGLTDVQERLRNAKRIIITACGTSWHAALTGEYLIETLAQIPVEVEYASEFRYRNAVITKDDVVFVISQSGETADTLAAAKEAQQKGALVLGIVNAVGSTIARETEAGIYIHAGPEIGVASTKAFTSQLTVLTLLALYLGRMRNVSEADGIRIAKEIQKLPGKIQEILDHADRIEEIAKTYKDAKNFIYLGRGYNFPVALEGALKLKEISYIHAEGYPAAEMKHGPIALIDKDMPVVFIAPKDEIYDKIVSNIEEVRSRNGKVIAIATEGDHKIARIADHVIYIPETLPMLSAVLAVIPLQLLSYYIAVELGRDVDKPRNLAKSVTVE
ncbi:MAG: glutamine--fructose-6-phosphate transaminase (isomerizing) [bacterium]